MDVYQRVFNQLNSAAKNAAEFTERIVDPLAPVVRQELLGPSNRWTKNCSPEQKCRDLELALRYADQLMDSRGVWRRVRSAISAGLACLEDLKVPEPAVETGEVEEEVSSEE